MSYNERIQATEQDTFAELYEFKMGMNVSYYTSYRKNVLFAGNKYLARPIQRSDFKLQEKLRAIQVTVSAPVNPIGLNYIANAPMERILVRIIRVFLEEPQDSKILFDGEVISVTIKENVVHAEVDMTLGVQRNKVPRIIYQPNCNWMLFEPGCGLNEAAWRETALVNVDGSDLVSSTFSAQPDGYFTGGHVERLGDYRWITNHVGDRITLQVPFDSRVITGVSVFAYPGCDGNPATCKNKFNNFANMISMPYIPSSNPVIFGLRA